MSIFRVLILVIGLLGCSEALVPDEPSQTESASPKHDHTSTADGISTDGNLGLTEEARHAKTHEMAQLRRKEAMRRPQVFEYKADPYLQKLPGLQEMLDSIPQDSQPRDDVDGMIELIKANEWLENNLVGKQVEFKAHIRDATVFDGGEGMYEVKLTFAHRADVYSTSHVGKVLSGGIEWSVVIKWSLGRIVVDEAMFRRLQKLRGTDVTISGIVSGQRRGRSMPGSSYQVRPGLPAFSVIREMAGKVSRRLNLELTDVRMEGF